MEPIKPHMIINIDVSSLYAYEGVVSDKSNKQMHRWTRVSNKSLSREQRKKSSYWEDDDNNECNKNSTRVKCVCGVSGSLGICIFYTYFILHDYIYG